MGHDGLVSGHGTTNSGHKDTLSNCGGHNCGRWGLVEPRGVKKGHGIVAVNPTGFKSDRSIVGAVPRAVETGQDMVLSGPV